MGTDSNFTVGSIKKQKRMAYQSSPKKKQRTITGGGGGGGGGIGIGGGVGRRKGGILLYSIH